MENLIHTDHLIKIYNLGDFEIHALRGIDLSIEKTEFVAIMGPSGSGKSTFMNILGCLDRPTKGSYFLEGEDISQFDRNRLARIRNRKIGFVFQTFNLLSRTTALENVELPMLYNGTDLKDRNGKARNALAMVGLEGRGDHYPNQLSGGQQQRVAIARALVNDPAIILADEPTGNLDTRTSIEVMEIFQSLNESGITIILITHEKDIAAFAKRNISFRDGRIVKDEIVKTPQKAKELLLSLPPAEEDEIV